MLARSLSAVAHKVFSKSCRVLLVELTAALRPGFFRQLRFGSDSAFAAFVGVQNGRGHD